MLNHILGRKISITSRRPQTTRHRVLGIHTENSVQAIYVDTPGLHLKEKRAINKYMNRAAQQAITDVDIVIFMVEANTWLAEDEWILRKLEHLQCPIFLVINKIDRIKQKTEILPQLDTLASKANWSALIPLSARRKKTISPLLKLVSQHLPVNPHFFPEEQITDKSEQFLVAELIREKIMRSFGDELPYATTVTIESFERIKHITHIDAVILAERDSQKAILIGSQGQKLKAVGKEARIDCEHLLQMKVFLSLWVKVKAGWTDNTQQLRNLGFTDA